MRKTLRWLTAAAAGLTASVACGGGGDGTGPGGGGGGNATITAKIDGATWTADANRIQILAGSVGIPGSLLINASRVNGNQVTTISLSLGFVKFQANYPLGVNNGTTPGGLGMVIEQSGTTTESRMTPLDGASGKLVLVSRSGNRVRGTFEFVAQPLAGQAVTGNRTVTEGTFEFDLPDDFTEVGTTNYGSEVHATLNGQLWTGATNLGLGDLGVFVIGGQTTRYSLQITNTTPVTGAVTFNMLAGAKVSLLDFETGNSWGGISGDSGTVHYNGVVDGVRTLGSFSGKLAPNFQGGTPVTITDGSFNVLINEP